MPESRFSRRSFLTALASIPIWMTLPSGLLLAATLRLRQIRSYSAPDHTRLVLDLDSDAPFDTRMLHDTERLLLEIRGAAIEGPGRIALDDAVVAGVAATPTGANVLVQIDLKRPCDFVAFALPPAPGAAGHRIVIDVRPRLSEAEKEAQEREVEKVRQSGDVVVAVDAGHGGTDPGCSYGKLVEKDVALDVARRVVERLSATKGRRGLLTRSRDYFVPLAQRPQVARKFDAALFVSIHVNSASSPQPRGSEVFFLSLQGAADKAARELVDRENAADLVGGVPPGRVQEPLVEILMNLKQNDTMRRSEQLGEAVLQRLGQMPGNETRALRQGPLAVLKSIASPSVLVELGFITNERDYGMMSHPDTKQRYAQQIALGIEDYLSKA